MNIFYFFKSFRLFLLALNLLFGFYVYVFFEKNAYLPPPFFFDINDTMMDLYNPYYFSSSVLGVFSEWKAIYSNFTFFILEQFFFNNDCIYQISSPFALRDCDYLSLTKYIGLCAICLLSFAVLISKSISKKLFSNFDKFILILFVLTSPVFYASFERGNTFIIAAIFFNFFLLSSSSLLRGILVGLIVNLKIYFILIALPVLLHNKIKLFIQIFLFCILFYLIFFYLYFDDESLLFFYNLFDFADIDRSNYANFYLNLSLLRLVKIFFNSNIFNYLFVPIIIIYLFNIFLANKYFKFEETMLMTFLLGIILMPNFGFYFILVIISSLISSIKYDRTYFIFLLLLLLPFDYFVIQGSNIFYLYSWLGNQMVSFNQTFSLGDILRPILVFSLFSYQTLKIGLLYYNEKKSIN